MSETILSVQNLHTSFTTGKGEVHAVNGVSFDLDTGKILGIVGESGSGKSVTAYSIMRILESNGRIEEGSVLYKGKDVTKFTEKEMRDFRGKCCSIIFQDPMTSLNPVFTVGSQLREAIELHTSRKGKEAEARAIEMLTLVGVNEPEKRIKQYPYELSGGMRQRVMIAMALSCEPDILIADEPTTALDVTIQAQILELMQDLQKQLRSIPNIGRMGEKLVPIPGTPINLLNMPKGCAFCPRCENAMKICLTEQPPEMQVQDGHRASCWLNVKAEMEKGEV